MNPVSQQLAEKARNLEAQVMRGIAHLSQTRLADKLGVDDSTINRWITSESGLRRACDVLAALGLCVRPDDQPDFSESYVGALETLARVTLEERRKGRAP